MLKLTHTQARIRDEKKRAMQERMRVAARQQAKVVADVMKRRSDALRYEKARQKAALVEKEQRKQKAIRAAAQVTSSSLADKSLELDDKKFTRPLSPCRSMRSCCQRAAIQAKQDKEGELYRRQEATRLRAEEVQLKQEERVKEMIQLQEARQRQRKQEHGGRPAPPATSAQGAALVCTRLSCSTLTAVRTNYFGPLFVVCFLAAREPN